MQRKIVKIKSKRNKKNKNKGKKEKRTTEEIKKEGTNEQVN